MKLSQSEINTLLLIFQVQFKIKTYSIVGIFLFEITGKARRQKAMMDELNV
jgi:hypothetical protein